MTELTVTEQKLAQATKRLQESIQSRQRLERQYERDTQRLNTFIGSFFQTVLGVDSVLDQKLLKLRGQLQKNPSVDSIEAALEDINDYAQSQQLQIQRLLKDGYDILEHLANSRNEKLLPTPILTSIKQTLALPALSVTSITPLLVNVIHGLQQTYQQFATKNAVNDGDNNPTAAIESISLERLKQWRKELINLLSMLDFGSRDEVSLQTIRQKLTQQLSRDQLLEQCIKLIRIVLASIREERKSAQHFLSELTDTLTSLQQTVATSKESQQLGNQQQNSLTDKLTSNVQALSNTIEHASDLVVLKQQVQQQLRKLAETVQQKKQLEEAQQRKLSNQFSELESRAKDFQQQAKEYKKRLSEQRFKSLQDSLTRLPNRAAFEERFALEYKRWQKTKAPLVVAIADVDHFKRINDNYGHTAGDKTLQVIANVLKKSLGQAAFISRYGGEEFVMLLADSDSDSALKLLERARTTVREIPFRFKNEDISITISFGMADFQSSLDTMSSVFEKADNALYKAKSEGRDIVIRA
ncbi:hypothetical protein CWI84_05680 [Idiomarina tyrosinivorans]|uniref:diguanylate cyclase n=1 Tax=Idiomarina tyrosinivorans TaxID=1445662 RepID=A0A432ZRT5_9GAMM|nr:GGDEF domain-containing protein [Idiomarina tyrosinivorans]RUO80548.1 hypothetical protein CWI84_05680 [Idiomarina tyrosinivorans]